MDFARDPATGFTNVGLRRFMIRGRNTTGIDLVAPSDLRNIYLATLARKERLPMSVVVGGHPVDYFGATMRMPGDELSLLASLRAAPMPVVKCITNDQRVPADAEWVLEGYLGEEGYVEPEGPYGEFLGYYGGVKTNPIFHVTAITRRRDALFQTLTIGGATMSCTDTAQRLHLQRGMRFGAKKYDQPQAIRIVRIVGEIHMRILRSGFTHALRIPETVDKTSEKKILQYVVAFLIHVRADAVGGERPCLLPARGQGRKERLR
jgi:UbiD family decarboxylase